MSYSLFLSLPGTGIEPVRDIISADFKSAASTNSAIPAESGEPP